MHNSKSSHAGKGNVAKTRSISAIKRRGLYDDTKRYKYTANKRADSSSVENHISLATSLQVPKRSTEEVPLSKMAKLKRQMANKIEQLSNSRLGTLLFSWAKELSHMCKKLIKGNSREHTTHKDDVEEEASGVSTFHSNRSQPIPIPGTFEDKEDRSSMLWLRVQHVVNMGFMDRETATRILHYHPAAADCSQRSSRYAPSYNLADFQPVYRLEVLFIQLILGTVYESDNSTLTCQLPLQRISHQSIVKAATTSSPKAQVTKKPPATFHLVAGAASGFTSSVLLQPADLLKTRVQQSRSHSLLATLRSIASSPQPIRQLWRGTLPSAIRTSVGSALYFTTLNALRTHVARNSNLSRVAAGASTQHKTTSSTLPQLSSTANLACGGVARASVGFIMMPITVIKVRYESSYYSYKSLFSAARDIGSKEGIRGFFAGFGATAIRDAPYAGLYVVFYEQGKNVLGSLFGRVGEAGAKSQDSNLGALLPTGATAHLTPSLSALTNFLSSIIAASAATMVTNPPDTIKTRLQLRPDKYRNSLQTLKLLLKEEGLRSLFDGLALRMTRKALSSALAWTVYEDFVRRAEARWVRYADD